VVASESGLVNPRLLSDLPAAWLLNLCASCCQPLQTLFATELQCARFDAFLKENDEKVQEAIRRAEAEAKVSWPVVVRGGLDRG